MSGNNGMGSEIWKQMQKVRIDNDGTFRAPVKANGKDGIVLGDPQLDVLGTAPEKKRGLGARLKQLLRR